MSESDWETIANIIDGGRGLSDATVETSTAYIARCIAEHMAQDNPAFDRERFLGTCGVRP